MDRLLVPMQSLHGALGARQYNSQCLRSNLKGTALIGGILLSDFDNLVFARKKARQRGRPINQRGQSGKVTPTWAPSTDFRRSRGEFGNQLVSYHLAEVGDKLLHIQTVNDQIGCGRVRNCPVGGNSGPNGPDTVQKATDLKIRFQSSFSPTVSVGLRDAPQPHDFLRMSAQEPYKGENCFACNGHLWVRPEGV